MNSFRKSLRKELSFHALGKRARRLMNSFRKSLRSGLSFRALGKRARRLMHSFRKSLKIRKRAEKLAWWACVVVSYPARKWSRVKEGNQPPPKARRRKETGVK